MGNDELSAEERTTWRKFDRIAALPPEQMLPAFVATSSPPASSRRHRRPTRSHLGWRAARPGCEPSSKPSAASSLDLDRLRAFDKPVLFALGGKAIPATRPDGERAVTIFPDSTLEVFAERHHFDPPHRIEPGATATVLRALSERASG